MNVSFAKPATPTAGALAVTVAAGGTLGTTGKTVDDATGGALTRAMAAGRFAGKREETLTILAPHGLELSRIVLIGLGKAEQVDALTLQAVGGVAAAALEKAGDAGAAIALDLPEGLSLSPADAAAEVAYGARLRGYRFDKYRTREAKDQKPTLTDLTVQTGAPEEAAAAFAPRGAVAEAVAFTRDLVSEPANVIYPETLANACVGLSAFGVSVQVLDLPALQKLGMGALLGVAQGSAREPRVVVMRWDGAPGAEDKRPLAFVGKGVTFDTGGISIKPAAGMEDMKWDMGGSATVIGLMRALAARKARVNAVGIVGLVENMPSGTAQRPGDVVTSLSGQTIEVINTDAEGRLVLADCLWYAKETFTPRLIVDLATLTGAIMVALGTEYAGLFANDDALAAGLAAAGTAVGEPLWRMPMGDAYDKEINSDIADMKNTGAGRNGGSITAAQFLKRFVGDVPWAHLDIAGMAWTKKDSATVPKGASGFGVRLLDRFVADRYETA
ncbi:leucyl aminopeptidase [Azospirillum fermentarium]|uniref:leucyl aminopeptidase n=1 Tax=Azospirillum fermentarium TaxID=1233114 RepID=UPI0022274A80|nr:leucyl aminopeptidase [Azospirillum fermentarium]MCW2248388.1 leucyl aminopeptidase [Azospirillum fermentarium]